MFAVCSGIKVLHVYGEVLAYRTNTGINLSELDIRLIGLQFASGLLTWTTDGLLRVNYM